MPKRRPNWPRDKRAVLTEQQAADVIRHCRQPCDDDFFAELYGVSRQCISNIRRGQAWEWLRTELSCAVLLARSS